MGRRGHLGFGWFVLGALFGPFGVVLASDASRNDERLRGAGTAKAVAAPGRSRGRRAARAFDLEALWGAAAPVTRPATESLRLRIGRSARALLSAAAALTASMVWRSCRSPRLNMSSMRVSSVLSG